MATFKLDVTLVEENYNSYHDSYKMLASKIMEQAIYDYKVNKTRDVISWFKPTKKEDNYIFSFNFICDQLNLPKDKILKELGL